MVSWSLRSVRDGDGSVDSAHHPRDNTANATSFAEGLAAMKSRYVEVFISHKMEDAEKAKALKRCIETFGLTCWIDADDDAMKRLQQVEPVDYAALTDRIREHLRTCRCLIFAFSSRSRASR
jgi:hypothetical protein